MGKVIGYNPYGFANREICLYYSWKVTAGSWPMERSWLIPFRGVTTTSWRAEGWGTAGYWNSFNIFFESGKGHFQCSAFSTVVHVESHVVDAEYGLHLRENEYVHAVKHAPWVFCYSVCAVVVETVAQWSCLIQYCGYWFKQLSFKYWYHQNRIWQTCSGLFYFSSERRSRNGSSVPCAGPGVLFTYHFLSRTFAKLWTTSVQGSGSSF